MSYLVDLALTAGTPQSAGSPDLGSGWATVTINNLTTGSIVVTVKSNNYTLPPLSSGTFNNPGMASNITLNASVSGDAKLTWYGVGESLVSLTPISATVFDIAAGASVDANITGTSVDIPVTGTVTANLASGSTVEMTTSSTSPPVVNLGTGNQVNVEDISGGTINNIQTISGGNNQAGNGSPNNPLPDPTNTPTVTVIGATGTTGYTYYYTVSNEYGETLLSNPATINNGYATLSTTNYNQILANITVPANLGGNLVYDSNLTNAIATTGATWMNQITIGTANGDINVLNPGTSSAEYVYYGTGVGALGTYIVLSAVLALVPGNTYTLSAYIDASNCTVTSGGNPGPYIGIYWGGLPQFYVVENCGSKGVVSVSFTVPSGVTSGQIGLNAWGVTVAAGAVLGWSQIQLTQTSTVQPYQPGPLWTVRIYNGTPYPIVKTTALGGNDQGQPPVEIKYPPLYNGTGFAKGNTDLSTFSGIRQEDSVAACESNGYLTFVGSGNGTICGESGVDFIVKWMTVTNATTSAVLYTIAIEPYSDIYVAVPAMDSRTIPVDLIVRSPNNAIGVTQTGTGQGYISFGLVIL